MMATLTTTRFTLSVVPVTDCCPEPDPYFTSWLCSRTLYTNPAIQIRFRSNYRIKDADVDRIYNFYTKWIRMIISKEIKTKKKFCGESVYYINPPVIYIISSPVL